RSFVCTFALGGSDFGNGDQCTYFFAEHEAVEIFIQKDALFAY
ncbi:MAG: hypothetical protein RLY82_280, partial [Pseudomonadota bacterium]